MTIRGNNDADDSGDDRGMSVMILALLYVFFIILFSFTILFPFFIFFQYRPSQDNFRNKIPLYRNDGNDGNDDDDVFKYQTATLYYIEERSE